MGQFAGLSLAVIAGYFTWGTALLLLEGQPRGVLGATLWLMFLAPVVAVAVPLANRSFQRQSPAVGLWILALAPLLGLLNFFPISLLFYLAANALLKRSLISSWIEVIAVVCAIAIWIPPLYFNLRSAPRTLDDQGQ